MIKISQQAYGLKKTEEDDDDEAGHRGTRLRPLHIFALLCFAQQNEQMRVRSDTAFSLYLVSMVAVVVYKTV